MNRLLPALLTLTVCLSLDGCKHNSPPGPPTIGDTYRPVYAPYSDIRMVETLGPQPLKNAGKIYVKDNYLFVNEVGNGIHVIDNRDPQKPVNLSFISIPGNQELSVKDSTLYADNVLDLVALNIADPRNVRLVKRIENAFEYPAYPLATNVRFECVDRERGVVIRWEKAPVENPQCFR
ncbi:hypothetical protein [Spirosoma sp.]|uniref:hypothetical protein n=1 Tax=Spirosoma sp. TaxID=1899569 RepID=UPI003B3AEA39